jgi:hypothetical protein
MAVEKARAMSLFTQPTPPLFLVFTEWARDFRRLSGTHFDLRLPPALKSAGLLSAVPPGT